MDPETAELIRIGERVLEIGEGYVVRTGAWGKWFVAPCRQGMMPGWVAIIAPTSNS